MHVGARARRGEGGVKGGMRQKGGRRISRRPMPGRGRRDTLMKRTSGGFVSAMASERRRRCARLSVESLRVALSEPARTLAFAASPTRSSSHAVPSRTCHRDGGRTRAN